MSEVRYPCDRNWRIVISQLWPRTAASHAQLLCSRIFPLFDPADFSSCDCKRLTRCRRVHPPSIIEDALSQRGGPASDLPGRSGCLERWASHRTQGAVEGLTVEDRREGDGSLPAMRTP